VGDCKGVYVKYVAVDISAALNIFWRLCVANYRHHRISVCFGSRGAVVPVCLIFRGSLCGKLEGNTERRDS
jgi:hypothetical protein